MQNRTSKKLLILVLIYLCAFFIGLRRFPKVWMDESWESVTGYTFAKTGKLANPVLKGYPGNPDQHFLEPRITQSLFLAFSFRLFGIGLMQGRAVSVLFGLLALFLTFKLGCRLFRPETAFLASLLLIFDNVFFVGARTIRPDIMVAAIGLGSLFFLVAAFRSDSFWHYALAGGIIGFGLYTHVNTSLFFIGLVAVMGFEFRSRCLRKKGFWIFLSASLIVFLPYAGFVLFQDAGNGFQDFIRQLFPGSLPLLSGDLLSMLKAEWMRYASFIHFPYRAVVFLVVLAGLIFGVFKHSKAYRYIVFLVAVHFFGFVFLIAHKTPRFLTPLIPLFSLLVASMILEGVQWSTARNFWKKIRQLKPLPVLASLVLVLYFGNQAGGDLYGLWTHRDCRYERVTSLMRKAIPRGARVWGSFTFWLGLFDYPYQSEQTFFEYFHVFKPEYVLLYDSELWEGRTATGRFADTSFRRPLTSQLEDIVGRKGSLVFKIEDDFYGNIEIYRLKW